MRQAFDQQIGTDPLRLDLGQSHPLGDNGQFVRRHERQLPLVAHFGAARIPRLASAGATCGARMEIAVDAVEAKMQFLNRTGFKMIERRDVKRRNLRGKLARRDDFDRIFALGEKIQHGFGSLHEVGLADVK